MKKNLCPELVAKVRAELKKIQEDCYCISDVSDDMKKFVVEVFGPADYTTSGYWVRVENYFKAQANA